MNTRSSPGLGQWIVATLIITVVGFLLFAIYQYGNFRQYYPAGLTIGSVEVAGLTPEGAAERLTEHYLQTDIVIYHGSNSVAVSPERAEFRLDLETMLNQADFQRVTQDFWSGFWGYLWNRPVEVEPVELRATHNPASLQMVLETIASGFDVPAQPPQPVPTNLSFEYGNAGVETDIEASMNDVVAALYRPTEREAHLTLRAVNAERPDINILARLIVNHLQDRSFSGVASIFIMDLSTGEEVRIEAGAPMTGMDLLRLPIALETYRVLPGAPSISQTQLITETLTIGEAESANRLLSIIAGQDDPFLGADIMTDSLWRLGLQNTFMATPYELQNRPGQGTRETPANSQELLLTNPNPAIQTTAEDIGTLLGMLYYCATNGGGSLRAAYGEQLTQTECQQIINHMQRNRIGSLIEEGVPPDVPVAHRHGWVSDTHADAGIVFSPGGDYVLVQMFYQQDWLPWEISSPLMAQISRATYNYFNFSDPYLDNSRAN
jgi:hypothetical protein